MLSLAQAVRNAIEAERAAARFYRGLASRADDDAVRQFFLEMAAQEEAHAASIEQLGQKMQAGELPLAPDHDVRGVESAPGWSGVEQIEMDQALVLALEGEQHASLYYEAIGDSCTGEVASFFKELARNEDHHAEALQKLIAQRND